MSSLAGALDGYAHPRHSKTPYNHASDGVDMLTSKNDSEAQDDDEEMDDDLFGNDNDVEEQKHLGSVKISELNRIFISHSFPYFQNTCIAHCFRPGFATVPRARTKTGLGI